MSRIQLLVKQFLKEPWWFKFLILVSFLVSIVFSSSYFSENVYLESLSKLAAGVIFFSFGVKWRMNRRNAIILFGLTAICLLLAILALF